MALIMNYLDSNGNIIKGQLRMSTQSRASGNADGNIFFNTTDWTIELITYEDGLHEIVDEDGATIANPLQDYSGITPKAVYGFWRYWVRHDETLRTYKEMIIGNYAGTGAYSLLNNIKFSSTGNIDDKLKIRLGGWRELDENEVIKEVYSGITSIANINAGTMCQYQLVDENADFTNFSKAGPIGEVIHVYSDGNFNKQGYIKLIQRTWGSIHDENTLADMGQTSLLGQNNNTAMVEQSHPTTGNYNEVDTRGGAAIAPWTGMSLERYNTPQTRTGFDNGDGSFTWILHNDNNGTLAECIAYLDACARATDNIDSGTTVGDVIGIKTKTWYRIINGIYETQSGLDNGLHIDNVPVSDRQKIKQIDDSGVKRYYPVQAVVKVKVLDVNNQQPIEGARVFIEKVSDGTDLFNSTSDANGEISFGITWTEDIPVQGRVRHGTCTGDPSCILYKTSVLGGVIKSSGMEQTIYMVRDQ